MSNNEEILSVEQETDHNIKMGEALKRLRENKDFRNLILDGYLRDKVLASVSLLAVPQIKSQGRRPDIMEDMVAASNLQFFFQMVDDAYIGAVDPVLSDEEEEALNGQ